MGLLRLIPAVLILGLAVSSPQAADAGSPGAALDLEVDWRQDFGWALPAETGLLASAEPPGAAVGRDAAAERFEPDEQRRRRRRRRKRYNYRYSKRERTLGFSLQTGFSAPIGKTIRAYGLGPMAMGRFNFHLGDGTLVFFDVRWSFHNLRNARPLFFRTSVTDSSTSGGTLHTLGTAGYFGYTIPLGYGVRNRARINPRTYFGVGPVFTFADAFITNTGQKGTVRGRGTQVFLGFIPGLGVDFRIHDFFFVGVDTRFHYTVPLARPPLSDEFTIPRMYLYELAAEISYFFY